MEGRGRTRAYCSDRCVPKVRDRHRVRPGAKRESYSRLQIAERDKWRCHLCGGRVPSRKFTGLPDDPTIDHLVPLADGGDDTSANVALAHLSCNLAKGTKPSGEQLRLIG